MHQCNARATAIVAMVMVAAMNGAAQQQVAADEIARVQAGVGTAFAFLYQLPRDTAGAPLGSWVLDTDATTAAAEHTSQWRIVATQLTDTGQDLKVEEMVGEPGTSPAQLARAMAAMQQLEAKVSKAEAEASIELLVTLNGSETTMSGVPESSPRANGVVRGAQSSLFVRGHWTQVRDRDLEITVDRWVPATLFVRFATATTGRIHSLVVTARGSEAMIDRLLKESRWSALAELIE